MEGRVRSNSRGKGRGGLVCTYEGGGGRENVEGGVEGRVRSNSRGKGRGGLVCTYEGGGGGGR